MLLPSPAAVAVVAETAVATVAFAEGEMRFVGGLEARSRRSEEAAGREKKEIQHQLRFHYHQGVEEQRPESEGSEEEIPPPWKTEVQEVWTVLAAA